MLRFLIGAAAMLGFLLHGTVFAAPLVEHRNHLMEFSWADNLPHAGNHRERPEFDPGHTNGWCCGAACSVSVLPAAYQMDPALSGDGDEPERINLTSGFDPDGIRRPPKTTSQRRQHARRNL